MGRPRKVVTGQMPKENRDLDEIITGKKASKFGKYQDRKIYEETLSKMDHFEVCEELLRLGDVPSTDRKLCIERCLRKFDASKKPRISQQPVLGKTDKRTLEEIIKS